MLDRFLDWSSHLARRLPSVIPSSCALCGTCGDDALCSDCGTRFFSGYGHRCIQCGLPITDDTSAEPQRCGECLHEKRSFDATVVAADYAAPVDHLVLALKFGNRLALAPLFARIMRDALLRQNGNVSLIPDLLTAVPLGEKRLSERGFNQALEIAKPLARTIGVPLAPKLLVRTRDTLMQSRLHPDERHRNIRHAFALQPDAAAQVNGKHIGIVDDVMTTGETLNEIAAMLKRYGAARVTNLVFARKPPK